MPLRKAGTKPYAWSGRWMAANYVETLAIPFEVGEMVNLSMVYSMVLMVL